jgi:putative transposase
MAENSSYTLKRLSEITGTPRVTIMRRAKRENWPAIVASGNGGQQYEYPLPSLPADIQKAIINKEGAKASLIPALAPEAVLAAADRFLPVALLAEGAVCEATGMTQARTAWSPETAIGEDDLRDPRVRRILAILREVEAVPRNWNNGKRKWIEAVAIRYDTQWQSVYRWMKKYEKRGIAGIVHTKSTKDTPRKWTGEAIDYWIGLCLKREHRKINRKDLYDILVVEAHRRGWNIGSYESANWWYDKRVTPQLLALSRGGVLALDNAMSPILRDYSDLAPFEILVGDQHRFDFWVIDDETGEVFRPEGYFWQDLRTRIIYGAAIDKKYDAWLIGLALRLGLRCYGAFTSIYTDNGRPELSRYLTGILADFRALGFAWETTVDVPMNLLDVEAEDVNPNIILPGTHRKAIVKNAKAKMIEGTFNRVEELLRSRFRLPGSVKRLGSDIHEQEIDHQEAMRLAEQGRLPLFSEFVLTLYNTLDYYNRERAHRGVLKEWAWKPKPSMTTPLDCLKACYLEGWRPRRLSEEAVDLIFLARSTRPHTVNRGRINFANQIWEHDALCELPKGTQVDLRYNPMTQDELIVFHRGKYLCTALPAEMSSMKDMELAGRKIEEKRRRRKHYIEELRRLTSPVPDFREYSKVPELEKAAAVIGEEKRRRAIEQQASNRTLTQAELEEGVRKLEAMQGPLLKTNKPLPQRPGYFLDEFSRFEWCVRYEAAGGVLQDPDREFKEEYSSKMTPDQQEYCQMAAEYGG